MSENEKPEDVDTTEEAEAAAETTLSELAEMTPIVEPVPGTGLVAEVTHEVEDPGLRMLALVTAGASRPEADAEIERLRAKVEHLVQERVALRAEIARLKAVAKGETKRANAAEAKVKHGG